MLLLSTSSWSGLALLLLFFFFITSYVVSSIRSYRRLRHIPGPKLAAWTNLPLILSHKAGTTFTDFGNWASQYGALVRIGTNDLITSDPEVMRQINAVRGSYRRSDWYNAMRVSPRRDNIISIRDWDLHDERRRKMAAGYSGKENPDLEARIDDRVREFVQLIDSRYVSDEKNYRPMDLGQKTQFFTLDVISTVAFGAPFNDLRDDNDNHNYIHETEAALPVIILLTVMPGLHAFLERSRIVDVLAPSARDKTGLGKIIGIVEAKVGERFDEEGKLRDRSDMLGSFLRHGLTKEQAEGESMMQVLAGSDTTATSIRSTFLNVMSNPSVYRRLMDEIASGGKSGLIPPVTSDEIISDENAKRLPYLQACIKEGLRIVPPVTGLTSKEVPPGGAEISGYWVPQGAKIGYCALGVHHSTKVFGDDAQLFRPERWLLKEQGGTCPSVEQLEKQDRNNELVFSSGRSQCLGKPVAVMELNKVFVELFKRFDMTVCNPLSPMKSWCAGIFVQSDLWVRVTRKAGVVDEV